MTTEKECKAARKALLKVGKLLAGTSAEKLILVKPKNGYLQYPNITSFKQQIWITEKLQLCNL